MSPGICNPGFYSCEHLQSANSYIKGNKYYFYIKDHLGNNRVVADAKGEVVQRTDYYPYGMPHPNSTAEAVQPYKFGGKEYDTMHGLSMYDFVARSLGTDIPVFDRMDPMAEKYYNISPYVYCANNPIRFIDLRGDSISVSDELMNHFVNYAAFEKFATSKEGRKFLANYAAKGQTLFGHTFQKDGKYHKEGLNVNYTTKNLGDTRGTTGVDDNGNITVTLNSADKVVSQDGNTYNWGIGANKSSREQGMNLTLGTMSKVITLFHESFIHVDLNTQDFLNNGKFDNSIIPSNIKSWSSPKHYDHEYVKSDKYSGMWPGAALNGIIEVNEGMGSRYTNSQLNKMIWNYGGGK